MEKTREGEGRREGRGRVGKVKKGEKRREMGKMKTK